MSLNMRSVLGFCLTLALLLAASESRLNAQGKKSGSKAKIEATEEKPDKDGKQTVTITLDIEKGWHFYANPVGANDLVDVQTVVKITGKGKPEVLKIEYPEGTLHKDSVVGDHRIYEGKVTIKALLKRKPDDKEKLEVAIDVQACSKTTCLMPDTVKISVP